MINWQFTNKATSYGVWGQGAMPVNAATSMVPPPVVGSSLDAQMEPDRNWGRPRWWMEYKGYLDISVLPVDSTVDLTGTLSFVGSVTFKTMIGLAGVESFGGALALQARPTLSAALSSAGSLQLRTKPNYTGTLSPVGQIVLRTSIALTGALSFVGEFFKGLFRDLTGTLDQSGEIDAANIGEQQTDADDTKRWRKFQ